MDEVGEGIVVPDLGICYCLVDYIILYPLSN